MIICVRCTISYMKLYETSQLLLPVTLNEDGKAGGTIILKGIEILKIENIVTVSLNCRIRTLPIHNQLEHPGD